MIKQNDVRELAFSACFLGELPRGADRLDANKDFDSCNSVVAAPEPALYCHQAWKLLTLLVFQWYMADAVGSGTGMYHDMVGSDTAWEQIRTNIDVCNTSCLVP